MQNGKHNDIADKMLNSSTATPVSDNLNSAGKSNNGTNKKYLCSTGFFSVNFCFLEDNEEI